jgi:hypothetical protein
VWSAYWGLFYRKFFWDFIGGTLRNPGGLQPGPAALPFVAIIVTMPIVQIVALVVGVTLLSLETPMPFFKGTSIQRAFVVKIVLLLIQAFLAAIYYQGTNGALWSLISAFGYIQATLHGEKIQMAKGEDERV